MKRTADWIMYAILDAIVDMFFSFVQHVRANYSLYIYLISINFIDYRSPWKSIRSMIWCSF